MRATRSLAAILAVFGLTFGLAAADSPGGQLNVPPEGFTALFNGKDLTGWQIAIPYPERVKLKADPAAYERKVQERSMKLKHWTVKDGVLHYDGKGDSLQTIKDYGDIELLMEWKIAANGDSGVYLRGQPQVQIWDPAVKAAGGVGSGGLYNNQKNPSKPLKKADRPVGEWNSFRILMKGDRVTVYLNGEKVVDDTPLENYFQRGKPLPATGPIELQHHGDPLWFRNIFIKELPSNTTDK